ncbi:SAICAR synthase-like protein [Rickenella mellea]|uniref:Kinase n=1 Tax=Rickenella mellea TaxID=50990 RepID=A0A4Y7PTP3_9AGAM|nr:SAICAR synthase-like protein [Rickenella mellea]
MNSVKNVVPLTSQVGGHAGVMATEDGSLIIKPCLPRERDFYQLIASDDPRVRHLQPHVPNFYGTLKLEGKVDEQGNFLNTLEMTDSSLPSPNAGDTSPPEDQRDKSLVLENVSNSFLKPNVLDIKLGTKLYEDSASPEKIERMIRTARQTTSLETGVRMTGFQVYDYSTSSPAITPKSYGKSIKPADLPEAVARFFPISPLSYSVDNGSSSRESRGQGLPAQLLTPILSGILENVRNIRDAIAQTEMRMIAGSILIVYEADWEKAHEGLQALEDSKTTSIQTIDSKVSEGDEDVDLGPEAMDESGTDDEDGDEDEEDEEEEELILPFAVRLIDFAHVTLVPGEGADESVLRGLDTSISLLEGRLKEVENDLRPKA